MNIQWTSCQFVILVNSEVGQFPSEKVSEVTVRLECRRLSYAVNIFADNLLDVVCDFAF